MPIRWPWAKAQKRSTMPLTDPYVRQLLGYGMDDGVVVVPDFVAMNLSGVFRAVSLIAGSVATLPLRTYVTDSVTRLRTPAGSFLDNPAPMVNGRPMYSPFKFKELCMVHLLLHGNAYLKHVFNAVGAISGLQPILPQAVGVQWDFSRPGGRRYTVTDIVTGQVQELDATSLTHVMGISLDGLKGVSPITNARVTMSGALAGDRAASRAFTHGPLIGGLVTPDEFVPKDEAEETAAMLNQAMTGAEHAGEIVLLNQKLNFQSWQMTAADAQFLESREFSIEEIGRWFGIPPHLLGVTEKATSWGQGIAEQNRGLARYTLKQWTTTIDEQLSLLVQGKEVEFDYSEFMASTPEQQSTMLINEVRGQIRTPNEARSVLNLPPVDGGDTLVTPPGAQAAGETPAADPVPAAGPTSGGAA
jgi:HK97 family phage portal protein